MSAPRNQWVVGMRLNTDAGTRRENDKAEKEKGKQIVQFLHFSTLKTGTPSPLWLVEFNTFRLDFFHFSYMWTYV